MALSDTKIKQLKPGEKNYKVPDEKGVFLLVKTTGSKLWQMKYRFAGKENIYSIGSYPEISLKSRQTRFYASNTTLPHTLNQDDELKHL